MHNSTATKLKPGAFYRLNKRLGPIPEGIYRLESTENGALHFSVGKGRMIRFLIMFATPDLISPVSRKNGLKSRIRERYFFEYYYHMLSTPSAASPHLPPASEGLRPITACIMPPEEILFPSNSDQCH